MLRVDAVSYQFGSKRVVGPLSFEIPNKEHLLIVGPSGCGKTTLLHLLCGLLEPSQGKMTYNGTIINQLSPAALDHFRSRSLGIIFQTFHLIKALSVEQNLLLAQSLAGFEPQKVAVAELLASLGLLQEAKHSYDQLSVGQAQRVAIARALINHPKWIMADEPTSSLDDENAHITIGLLLQHAKNHEASLVVVTHDQRIKNHFDHILDLSKTGVTL